MIYETVRFSVPTASRDACREATRELVASVRDQMEEKVRSYLVLEGGDDEQTTYLHLAVFEDVDGRREFEDSEAFRMFHDLIYPATVDGIDFSEQTVVDRIPSVQSAVPQA
jgi:hypothetical protein